jgi:hypothetical protein
MHRRRATVPAQRQLAQRPAIAGDVRLAQFLAELGQVVDRVRVGSDEQVREPCRERPVDQIPGENALAGGSRYEPKWDGFLH